MPALRIEKDQAIRLRIQGKSYNQIRKLLNIPSKGTLSYWFKNFKLPPRAKKLLAHNMAIAQKRGLLRFNKERTKAIQAENSSARLIARNEVGTLSSRELLLVGASLYWGEGAKWKTPNNSSISFANSDAGIIRVFMRFVREILEIPEHRIRACIYVHPNLRIAQARQFWAHATKLPPDRFHIQAQISRASRFRRPKKILPYGTLQVRISRRTQYHRILGYIEGLSTNK